MIRYYYLRKTFKSLCTNLDTAKKRMTEKRNRYVEGMQERGWEIDGHEYSSNHSHIVFMRKATKKD